MNTDAAEVTPKAHLRGIRVLVVENDIDLLDALAFYLDSMGATVTTAANFAKAAQSLRESSFDLLVSDIELPDGSGLNLIAVARSAGQQLVSIALSGRRAQKDIDAARSVGFNAHIAKPCSGARLVAVAIDILRP